MSVDADAVIVDSLVVEPCPDCCECPTPRWRSAINTALFSKLGCVECVDPLPAVPKYYRRRTPSGSLAYESTGPALADNYFLRITGDTAAVSQRPGGGADVEGFVKYEQGSDCSTWGTSVTRPLVCPRDLPDDLALYLDTNQGTSCTQVVSNFCSTSLEVEFSTDSSVASCTITACAASTLKWTLDLEHTTAQLLEDVVAVLPGFASWTYELVSALPRAVLSITADEVTALARAERYALAFPLPAVATCFRASWIERFVPVAGASITSVDVATRGLQYTEPTITITDPTGTGATLSAVLERGRIVAFTVDTPGTGYTDPTITITDATGSGAAVGCIHFGTETARSAQWDGITPGGYDPEDAATWPRLTPDGTPDTYWTLDVPEALGTLSIACFAWSCRDCEPTP